MIVLDITPDTEEYLKQRVTSCVDEVRRRQSSGVDGRFAMVPFGEAFEERMAEACAL